MNEVKQFLPTPHSDKTHKQNTITTYMIPKLNCIFICFFSHKPSFVWRGLRRLWTGSRPWRRRHWSTRRVSSRIRVNSQIFSRMEFSFASKTFSFSSFDEDHKINKFGELQLEFRYCYDILDDFWHPSPSPTPYTFLNLYYQCCSHKILEPIHIVKQITIARPFNLLGKLLCVNLFY